MNLEAFSRLDYAGRLQATASAVCVAGRDLSGYKVLLYQLSDFYIEVYYQKAHHFISRIHAFGSTEGLEPYLEKITVAAV